MLRLSEHYTSVQGEGPRVGMLTQFVRFAGCNMRCPGWPCDTPHAILPEIWHHESDKFSVTDMIWMIRNEKVRNVCFTGGEPFMQPRQELSELVDGLMTTGAHTIEFFTNGSFVIPQWMFDDTSIHFMMDWKLGGSGEAETALPRRNENARHLGSWSGIKFVVTNRADLDEALGVTHVFKDEVAAQLWVAPAWMKITESEIVEFMKEYNPPWRLNAQLHKYIWPPEERGV